MRRFGTTARPVAVSLTPFLLLAVAWLLLRPGLGGAFLLDDLPNLATLGEVSLVDSPVHEWLEFASSQRSATGRPVSMLSFLLHASHWPFDAYPFLRTNLLVHIAIGLIILGLVRRLALLRAGTTDSRATAFAALVAGLWLLHPLQASTVFYTVQRMAQLSALFSLAAVYSYVVGRERLAADRRLTAWTFIGLTPLLALVGAYAKENAVLVPVALLLIEYWFFDDERSRTAWVRPLRVAMLWLPTGLIAAYLLLALGSDGYVNRDFTAAQRVMTQPRILFDYLDLLLRPAHVTTGLFNDTYPVSTAPWQPISTAFALAGSLALVAWAIVYRARYPWITWGVLFFFAMHLVESSTLPLELYFEHRNYLPSLGIMAALAAIAFRVYDYRRPLGIALLGVMLAIVAVIGHLRAQNWGHPMRQAEIWIRANPDSPRAWQNLALRSHERGDPAGVQYALGQWRDLRPDSILAHTALLEYECPQTSISSERWKTLRRTARHGAYRHGLLVSLDRLANQSVKGTCRGVRPDQVHVLIRSVIDNPDLHDEFIRQRLWNLDGQLLMAAGFIEDAMEAYRHSHRRIHDPQMRLAQARGLARQGYRQEALSLLEATDRAATTSVYGPLHVYWLVHEPARVDALAREIRSGKLASANQRSSPAEPAPDGAVDQELSRAESRTDDGPR